MGYDPRNFVDPLGANISALGDKFRAGAMNFLQNNAAWQKHKQETGDDLNLKKKMYESTVSLLQEKGIDPNTYQMPSFQDERLTPEDYTQKLAESIQGAFVGQGAKLDESAASEIGISNQQGVKDNIQMNKSLDQFDPMSQIDMSKVQNTTPETQPGASPPLFLDSLQVANGQSQAVPSAPAPIDDDPFSSNLAEMQRLAIGQARQGIGSAKDLHDSMADISKLKLAHDTEKTKERIAIEKTKQEELRKQRLELEKISKQQEGDETLRKMQGDSALQIEREGNASAERIATLNGQNRTTKEDRALVQIDKTLRNDYVVKQRTEQLQYAKNTLDLLNSDNPVANQASKTQLARLSGEVGVLTDKDTERFGGSKAVLAKIGQATKEAMTGRLSNENKKFLTDLAETFHEAARRSLNERLGELAQGQSEAFEVPIERITPLVNAYGLDESKDKKDKFVTGKIYPDANGNKAKYLGNGQWEEVK